MMIQKLKMKFVLINMSLVTLVLVIVFSILSISSNMQLMEIAQDTLDQALSRQAGLQPNRPEVGKGRNGPRNDMQSILPTFCVQLDQAGMIESASTESVSISDEVLTAAINHVLLAGNGSGQLREYGLRYAARFSSTGTKIAFVDLTGILNTLRQQGLLFLACGLCGLLSFFFISLFLADWALHPARKAWESHAQFVVDASGELKSPLSAILTDTDILLSHPDATVQEEHRRVDDVRAQALLLEKLAGDMLLLAEADSALPVEKEPVYLSECIQAAVNSLAQTAVERGVCIERDLLDGVMIFANPGQIKKLIDILLSNAVRAAGVGGCIRAGLHTDGRKTVFTVGHSGVPIDPADLPHVFERFYQTRAPRYLRNAGRSLALSVAEALSHNNGGEISVSSTQADGTVYRVAFKSTLLAPALTPSTL